MSTPEHPPTGLRQAMLPITAPLIPGQSLESWLEDIARRSLISVTELLPALGLAASTRPHTLLCSVPDEILANLARITGTAAAPVRAATLDRYMDLGIVRPYQGPSAATIDSIARDRSGHDRWHRWGRWARAAGARFCPQCLREDEGRWQLSWHLSWSFACLRHNVMLADRCPRCHQQPRAGENRASQLPPAPLLCGHRLPAADAGTPSASVCGTDLSAVHVPALEPAHPILTAQRWLNHLLGLEPEDARPATVMMCGIDTPAADAIDAVSAMITRIATTAPDLSIAAAHSIGSGHRIAEGLSYARLQGPSPIARMAEVDANSTQFAIAATAALDVLLSPSLARAADALERYEDLVEDSSLGLLLGQEPQGHALIPDWEIGQARSPSRLLTAIELVRKAPSMTTAQQLTFRTMSPIPRYPQQSHRVAAQPAASSWPDQPQSLGHIPARLIPQRIWPSVADALPRHATKDTGAFEWAMAMAIARIGTFARWSTLAMHLDLPERAAHSIQSVFRRLNEHGLLEETLFVLDGVAEALHSAPPPIDYARRRWIFRDLTTVSRGFRAACHEHGLIATDRRQRFAAMRLWEMLTGGDVRNRPGTLAPHGAGDRSAFGQFTLREGMLLHDFLRDDAERLLLRHRIDEPIQWQPKFDPDERAWRSPAPDLARSLPGWTSPSRAGTFRASARDHTARASRSLLEAPAVRTQDLCRALRPFSPHHNTALPEVLRLRPMADGRLTLRNTHRFADRRWDQRRQITAVLNLQKHADDGELIIEIFDGEWALTSLGLHLLEQLEWTCPSQLEATTTDLWTCMDSPNVAPTPAAHVTDEEAAS